MNRTAGPVDLHLHAGPDLTERRHGVLEAARIAQEMGGWIVVKSHLGSTCAGAWEARREGLPASGSIVLNPILGDFGPTPIEHAVYTQGLKCPARVIVYLPTMRGIHTHGEPAAQLRAHPSFTRARWSTQEPFWTDARVAAADEVFRCIRDHDLVLATGHCTRDESLRIVDRATTLGVEHVLITHALLPMSGFSLAELADLATNDAVWIEVTALGVLLHRHPASMIAQAERSHPRVVLSSDLGQPDQPDLIDGWSTASQWVAPEPFDRLSRINPSRLLFRHQARR